MIIVMPFLPGGLNLNAANGVFFFFFLIFSVAHVTSHSPGSNVIHPLVKAYPSMRLMALLLNN